MEIKRWRVEKNLKQSELAEQAQITQAYLSGLETGRKQNPSLAVLTRIAKALGKPVAELVPQQFSLKG